MNKILFSLVLVLFFIILPSASYTLEEDVASEEMRLYLGEIKILAVNDPSRIVIGNPAIVDVTAVTENSITVVPKAAGTTTFVFWDNFGEQSYRVRVLAENVDDIKLRIDNLLKELNLTNVYTKAVATEGKVFLLGEVRTAQDKERIDLALGPLKEKITDLVKIKEEAIVDIDVQVLELDKDATHTLGFTWPSSITWTDSSGPTTTAVSFRRVFHVSDFTRTAFNLTLDALVQEGKARILSQPRLACLSGKEAELLVGGEKPIFTTSAQATIGTSTTVEYKEYGIKLKIKPTVVDNEKIQLALNVEVSEVQTAEFIGLTAQRTAQAYPLTKRNVSTELYLNDGQTMAIGGLIKQKEEEDIRKIAFLGDIPVLGALFRKRTTKAGGGQGERGNVELFITLTPTIVAGKESAKAKESTVSQTTAALPVQTQPLIAEENILPELKDYMKTVQLKIINAVYYPQEAKDLGWEGTVNLILRLAPDGNLREAKIAQSSAYKLLDDAALDVVQKQAPYPAFPAQVKLDELRIQVPIVYRKD